MQVSVETTSSLGRKLTIEVPKVEVENKLQEKIKKLSQTVRMDGFRKGKVPIRVIKERYGEQVRDEVVTAVVESSLKDALSQESLLPAGQPNVEELENHVDKDLKYVVSFEVFPEITLKDFSEMQLEKPVAELTDEDVEEALAKISNQMADWNTVERESKNGDKLVIDYEGTMEGETFEHGSGSDVEVELGAGAFIDGFEEGLVGVKAEDEKTLSLTFPKDYGAKDLAGKPVQFKVTIKSVKEKQPIEHDAEFAKKIGVKDENPEGIKDKIREDLSSYSQDLTRDHLKSKVVSALLAANPIEVPNAVLAREIAAAEQDVRRRSGEQALSEEQTADIRKASEKRAALGMLFNEIVKTESLEPDESRVKDKLLELAANFGNIEMIQKMYSESPELMNNIRSTVLMDQVVDFLIEKATVTEKTMSFKDLSKLKMDDLDA